MCQLKESSGAGCASGDEVDVSSIMGKGFPIDRIPPETVPTVYIFATVRSSSVAF